MNDLIKLLTNARVALEQGGKYYWNDQLQECDNNIAAAIKILSDQEGNQATEDTCKTTDTWTIKIPKDCFNCGHSGVNEDDQLWCSQHKKVVKENQVCADYN